MLQSAGFLSCRAAAASSSADCGASTNPTSAPASRYAFTRSIDACRPSTARASERAMITMSASRRVSTAALILPTISALLTICLPS